MLCDRLRMSQALLLCVLTDGWTHTSDESNLVISDLNVQNPEMNCGHL